MDERKNQLTVYFEDPFWVGVLERIEDGALSVCKVTFGAEPKDYEGRRRRSALGPKPSKPCSCSERSAS